MVKFAEVNEQYEKWRNLKKEDVMNVMEWMQHQPHLPKISELQVILFLHSCYYSNEATKQCIDNYYTVRAYCPEFFASRNPNSSDIKTASNISAITPLPKLSPEGYAMFYMTLTDTNPEQFILNRELKLFDMMVSHYLAERGAVEGHVLILDVMGFTLTHLLKLGIMSVKKYLFFLQEALPVRLKGVYFVNAVTFMDKIIALLKPFMKKELMDMIRIHETGDVELYKVLPKDCLPSESGGNLGAIVQIHNANFIKILDSVQYFVDEEKLIADESKRPGKPKNVGDLFGVEGTFKKLDID